MGLFKRNKPNQAEHRNFTDGVIAQILAMATGGKTTASAYETAAAEYAIGLISRCFAAGKITPAFPGITPAELARMARSILVSGNYAASIDVNDSGIRLIRATTWDIQGGYDPDSWQYTLDLPGPSLTTTRHIPAAGVVHCRMNENPATPWKGRSPLEIAGVSSSLMANLELRMSQEANSKTGYLLPIPEGMDDEPLAKLQADLAAMAGGVGLTETANSGYGTGRANAPLVDWVARRFGAAIPEHNVIARRDAVQAVFTTLGIPAAMMNADGAALREGYRQLLTTTIQPMADIVASELSEKLERDIEISFPKLAAIDITARSRAFGSLVQGGIDPDKAILLAGLGEA